MSKRNINQKSIAKSLNLSVATVSKALSDYADVNSTTRDKVVNMATKMGYKYRNGSKEKSAPERKNYFVGVLRLAGHAGDLVCNALRLYVEAERVIIHRV